jgi:hypothetical protein
VLILKDEGFSCERHSAIRLGGKRLNQHAASVRCSPVFAMTTARGQRQTVRSVTYYGSDSATLKVMVAE